MRRWRKWLTGRAPGRIPGKSASVTPLSGLASTLFLHPSLRPFVCMPRFPFFRPSGGDFPAPPAPFTLSTSCVGCNLLLRRWTGRLQVAQASWRSFVEGEGGISGSAYGAPWFYMTEGNERVILLDCSSHSCSLARGRSSRRHPFFGREPIAQPAASSRRPCVVLGLHVFLSVPCLCPSTWRCAVPLDHRLEVFGFLRQAWGAFVTLREGYWSRCPRRGGFGGPAC